MNKDAFKLRPALVAIGLGLLIWFVIPVPAGVTANAWHLLALTGAAPMQLFGEWEPGRGHVGCWRLLSAWQADAVGALQCIWHHRSENV